MKHCIFCGEEIYKYSLGHTHPSGSYYSKIKWTHFYEDSPFIHCDTIEHPNSKGTPFLKSMGQL